MIKHRRIPPGYKHLTDQPEKLTFLLQRRGDQRRQESLGSSKTVDQQTFVTSQQTLAIALGLHSSAVTKWLSDELSLSHTSISKLCEIFAVEADHLVEWDFHSFELIYSKARSGWCRLIDSLKPYPGQVHTGFPGANAFRLPTIRPAGSATEVRCHTPFWCSFDARAISDDARTWEDWYISLFSLDFRADRIHSYYADLCEMLDTKRPTFPPAGRFVFPSVENEMTSPMEDAGEHAFLCLILAPQGNPELLKAAWRQSIPSGHDRMADMLSLAIAKREAALALARYRVVA